MRENGTANDDGKKYVNEVEKVKRKCRVNEYSNIEMLLFNIECIKYVACFLANIQSIITKSLFNLHTKYK